MFAKVVVGVRDASHAQDAVALARVLAPGAQLHLVHAYPLALGTWSGAEPWHDGLRADAEELLGGIARDAHIDTPGRSCLICRRRARCSSSPRSSRPT